MDIGIIEFLFAYFILSFFFFGCVASIPLIIIDIMDRNNIDYDPTQHRKYTYGISIIIAVLITNIVLI